MEMEQEKTKRLKKKDVQSRLGRKPVAIPAGVKVTVNGAEVIVEGKRGKLNWTLPEIIQEMLLTRTSERQGRLIDHDSAGSMEKKKQEGYF